MLIFVGLMAAMLLAIWGVNTWWLEGYYVDQKLKVMEQAYTDIDSAIQKRLARMRTSVMCCGRNWSRSGISGNRRQREIPVLTARRNRPGQMRQNRLIRRMRPSRKICRKTFRQSREPCLERSGIYGEQNNIAIILIDSDTGKALISSGRDSDFLTQKLQRYVLGMGHKHMEILKQHDNYVVENEPGLPFQQHLYGELGVFFG